MTRPPTRLGPALAAAAVLAVGVAAVLLLGAQTVLAVAGALALLVLAALAASAVALTTVLRRRLGELRHLPDLGRRVVTQHDDATVTGLTRDPDGLVLHVAAAHVQEITLDESGAPDHAASRAAATSTWRIPAAAALDAEQLRTLAALQEQHVPVRVVAQSIVGLAGPVATGWRLEADNGLVVQAGG